MEKVVVIGAGSWGTALGVTLARKGHEVILWEYNHDKAKKLQEERVNEVFLKGVKFPDNINVTSEVEGLLKDVKYVIFSVPAQVLRGVVKTFSNQITEDMLLVNTAKGIEVSTGLRLSEVMKDELIGKCHKNILALSGPTHAEEVGNELPTTILVAGDLEKSKKIQELFSTSKFRVYIGDDIIGVELGGSVKNCLAIAAGIADGLGYGDNTKAALITRGIAEMSRLGVVMGAKEKTFSGLSGIGDLIVTCASLHSRNRHVGERLGKGESIDAILEDMVMVAEGVPTVQAVHNLAKEKNVTMPILEAVYQTIYEGDSPKELVKNLMERDLKGEF